ncbi:MAG: protein kinase [Myxococcota bacterium]
MERDEQAYAPTLSANLQGRTFGGRYQIGPRIGEGGLGAVHRATDLRLKRTVAVKVLHARLNTDPGLRERFDREIRMLSRLSHPNIVGVVDSGFDEGTFMAFLVMEFLEGEHLGARMARGPVDVALALEIVEQVLLALDSAHTAGVFHRDLKPANIFLQPLANARVHVKLLDFGLGKVGQTAVSSPGDFPSLTANGMVVGTPTYMAPEQAASDEVDGRSDLYSLMTVLYEMLTGRAPYRGETKIETIRALLTEELPAPETLRPGLTLTKELDTFLRRGLEKDKIFRFADAKVMLASLRALPDPAATMSAVEGPEPISGEESTLAITSSMLEKVRSPHEEASPAPSPPVRRGFVVGGAVAVFGLVALIGVGLWLVLDAPARAPDGLVTALDEDFEPDPEAEGPVSQEESPPPAVPEEAADEDDPNPFVQLGGLPPEIRRARRKILRGRWLSRTEVNSVVRFRRANPTDPRPSLLLARHHRLQGKHQNATRHYVAAYRADPSASAFAPMRADLVRAAMNERRPGPAGRAVAEIFGSEAVEEIDAQLARNLSPAQRESLSRLRTRLVP